MVLIISKFKSFYYIKNLISKSCIKTTTIFCLSKHIKIWAVTSVFHLNYTKKSTKATYFSSIKIRSKKYIKAMSIFCSSKLRQTKYVETTLIFCPLKLHRKSTLQWHGNLLIFSFWCINIKSVSNWHWFDVVYLLHSHFD